MASTYLTRTLTNSNQKKFTISVWVKRAKLGGNQQPIMGVGGSGNYATNLYFQSDDKLDFWNYFNGSYAGRITTNRKFRDTSGWYHIVAAVDTTIGTAGDRMRIYVNGVEETSFSTDSNPSQDQTFEFNSGSVHEIGRNGDNAHVYDGLMSHFHFCDGYQYAASDFGETDSTTGEWKIKTSPSVSYGTNGFWILKDGNSVTDSSANSNDFTVAAGTLLKSEDNPSNVFATFNNQHNYFEGATYSCGNNKIVTGGNNTYTYNNSSLGMTTGKYYCEIKNVTAASSDNLIGITDRFTTSATHELGNFNTQWAYRMGGGLYTNNTHTASWGASWAVGDFIGIGLDLDNNKLYFSKNGVWQNPSAGISITDPASVTDGCYYFSVCGFSDQNEGFEANFGNGSFGTTQLTGTTYNGADGNGVFKYDPNNITLDGASKSFKSLSTKGLNA